MQFEEADAPKILIAALLVLPLMGCGKSEAPPPPPVETPATIMAPAPVTAPVSEPASAPTQTGEPAASQVEPAK